nr:FAD-dependent oxidoreductase [Clostridia bacterium]
MEVSYSRKLEVKYNVDVFIAGGGPAGVAAAVSCARQGRSVFVAESFSAFGGAGVTMLVPAFMTFSNGVDFLAGGIGKEIYDKIGEQSFPRFREYCPMSIPVETLKIIYDDMVTDSGAQYLFHTNLIDVAVENGSISHVICAAKGSVFAVKAKVYIDCTGDGDLAYYAGAQCEYGDEEGRTMATTLCGIWTDIDWRRVEKPDSRRLEDAFNDGVFTNEDRHLPGMWKLMAQTQDENGNYLPNGLGGSNAGHIYDIDARHAESLTKGIVAGRKQLLEYRRYYREYLSGYENTELVYSASYLGIRESRRIVCDYTLVVDDFKRLAVFDDEIGRYNYNIDIHSPTNDKAGYELFMKEHTGLRLKRGESYGIPYRSLTVKGIDNLLTAGRCIGTDRHMQSSVRVMPGCYITGQAAGIAAAVVCDAGKTNVHETDVHEVQKRLVKMGAFLPNYKD